MSMEQSGSSEIQKVYGEFRAYYDLAEFYNVPLPLVDRFINGRKATQFSRAGLYFGQRNEEDKLYAVFRLFMDMPDTEDGRENLVARATVFLQEVFEGYILEEMDPTYAMVILPDKEDKSKFHNIDMTVETQAARVGLGVLRSLKPEDFGTL